MPVFDRKLDPQNSTKLESSYWYKNAITENVSKNVIWIYVLSNLVWLLQWFKETILCLGYEIRRYSNLQTKAFVIWIRTELWNRVVAKFRPSFWRQGDTEWRDAGEPVNYCSLALFGKAREQSGIGRDNDKWTQSENELKRDGWWWRVDTVASTVSVLFWSSIELCG